MAGTCKLRFVSRSEDVWYSNPRKSGAKRAASLQASTAPATTSAPTGARSPETAQPSPDPPTIPPPPPLQATRSGKRQQLDKLLGRGERDPQHNVLVGLRSAGPVQLPNASTWSPDITDAAA